MLRTLSDSENVKKRHISGIRKFFLGFFRKKKIKRTGKFQEILDTSYLKINDKSEKVPIENFSRESYLSTIENIDSLAFKMLNDDNQKIAISIQTDNHVACQKDDERKGMTCLYSINSLNESQSLHDNLMDKKDDVHKFPLKVLDVASMRGKEPQPFRSSLLFRKPNSQITVSSFELDDMNNYWIYGTHLECKVSSIEHKAHINTMKLIDQIDIFGDIIRRFLISTTRNKILKLKEGESKINDRIQQQNYKLSNESLQSIFKIINERSEFLEQSDKSIQVNMKTKVLRTCKKCLTENFAGVSESQDEVSGESVLKVAKSVSQPRWKTSGSHLKKMPKVNLYPDKFLSTKYQRFAMKNWKVFKKKLAMSKKNQLKSFDIDSNVIDYHFEGKSNLGVEILKGIHVCVNYQWKLLVKEIVSDLVILNFTDFQIDHSGKSGNIWSPQKHFLLDKGSVAMDFEDGDDNDDNDNVSDPLNCKSTDILTMENQKILLKYSQKSPINVSRKEPSNLRRNLSSTSISEDNEGSQHKSVPVISSTTNIELNMDIVQQSPLRMEVTNHEITYNPIYKPLDEETQREQCEIGILKTNHSKFPTFENIKFDERVSRKMKSVRSFGTVKEDNEKNLQDRKFEDSYNYPIFSAEDLKRKNDGINRTKLVRKGIVGREEYIESKPLCDETPSIVISTYSSCLSRSDNIKLIEKKMKKFIKDIDNKRRMYRLKRNSRKGKKTRECKTFTSEKWRNSYKNISPLERTENFINQLFQSDIDSLSGIELTYTSEIDNSIDNSIGNSGFLLG